MSWLVVVAWFVCGFAFGWLACGVFEAVLANRRRAREWSRTEADW